MNTVQYNEQHSYCQEIAACPSCVGQRIRSQIVGNPGSLAALRIIAALAGTALVALTILLARELGVSDGLYPTSSVAVDAAGNVYGTTFEGGTGNGGVVFEITP